MQTVLAPSLQVPTNLLTCPNQPVPGAMVNDDDLTDWIQDTQYAGAVCRYNLGATARLLATQKGTK